MTAEQLDEEVLNLLESGKLESNSDPNFDKKLPKLLLQAGWDALAAKYVRAFGPHQGKGPNVLLNDILDPKERVEAEKLKDSIVQGFIWATCEGPLTDEPVQGVKLSIIDMKIACSFIAKSPAPCTVSYNERNEKRTGLFKSGRSTLCFGEQCTNWYQLLS